MSRVKKRKVIGWEIEVFTRIPGMGEVLDYRLEYGNSPVRDRNARLNKIQELLRAGKTFTSTPIYNRKMTPDEIAKATKTTRPGVSLAVAGGA